MRKGYWYLSGFRKYGLKYWVLASIAKVLYTLRLISDEDCKRYGNALITDWITKQAEKKGLKAKKVSFFIGRD